MGLSYFNGKPEVVLSGDKAVSGIIYSFIFLVQREVF